MKYFNKLPDCSVLLLWCFHSPYFNINNKRNFVNNNIPVMYCCYLRLNIDMDMSLLTTIVHWDC